MKRTLLLTIAIGTLAGTAALQAQSVQQADQLISRDVPSTVEKVSLPEIALDKSMTDFVVPVSTSMIDAKNKLVGLLSQKLAPEKMSASSPSRIPSSKKPESRAVTGMFPETSSQVRDPFASFEFRRSRMISRR